MAKLKNKKIIENSILGNESLKNFVTSLKIAPEQEKFLLDEALGLNEEERVELINTMKDVYILNLKEKEAIEKIINNWKSTLNNKIATGN